MRLRDPTALDVLQHPNSAAPTVLEAADAIQYVPEGTTLGKKFDPTNQPLTSELKAKGMTDEQYETICDLLRKAFGKTGIDGGVCSLAQLAARETHFIMTIAQASPRRSRSATRISSRRLAAWLATPSTTRAARRWWSIRRRLPRVAPSVS